MLYDVFIAWNLCEVALRKKRFCEHTCDQRVLLLQCVKRLASIVATRWAGHAVVVIVKFRKRIVTTQILIPPQTGFLVFFLDLLQAHVISLPNKIILLCFDDSVSVSLCLYLDRRMMSSMRPKTKATNKSSSS